MSIFQNFCNFIEFRAKKDRSLPHMHLDSKSGDSFDDDRRGSRGGRGRSFSDRGRDRDRKSDRDGRFSKESRGRGRDDSKKKRSSVPHDRKRKDGLPGFERRNDEKTGNASLYKKKRF